MTGPRPGAGPEGDAPRVRRLAMVGHGAVGQAFVELLSRSASELSDRHRLRMPLTMVASRTGGVLIDPDGLSRARLRDHATGAAAGSGARPIGELAALLADPAAPYDVVVEITTVSPDDGEPAATYLRAALASGRDAVTANKGPIAWCGPELEALAVGRGVRLRYEATLMDCLPVQVLREAVVPVGRISAFAGIVNSTTNLMLSAMAAGRSATDALVEAQRMGIAEADPRHDTGGHDAALKATILANLLLEPVKPITPDRVPRIGLEGVAEDWPAQAARAGRRVRLVVRGRAFQGQGTSKDAGRTVQSVRVAPEELPLDDPLALVDGRSMALTVETELAGRLTTILTEPGVEQTAYALLMDLVALGLR